MIKEYCIATGCLFLSIVSAFPWGAEGHRAIAEAALVRLNTDAKTAVDKIIAESTIPEISDIGSATTWPDDIRESSHPGKFVHTDGAISFNDPDRFHGNRVWHFVDFPLGATYKKDSSFASETDIVHIIGHCIDVLEGTAQAPWNGMKPEEALAWLIHLAGDIHQPLHVGVGFYDFHGTSAILVTDPAKATGKPDDNGGNFLHFGASGNFHSFWDGDMVKSISTKEAAVISEIDATINKTQFQNTGNHHEWVARWATDTIRQAKRAYAGISDDDNSVGLKDTSQPHVIKIEFSAKDYKTQYAYLVRRQLAKAAFDLADLLNNIKWK